MHALDLLEKNLLVRTLSHQDTVVLFLLLVMKWTALLITTVKVLKKPPRLGTTYSIPTVYLKDTCFGLRNAIKYLKSYTN